VLLLDALPKGPTGKIQRIGLADTLGVGRDSSPPSPPRTPLQGALADLWAHVLGLDRVGIDDDFFVLGGDSLLAAELVAAVGDAFGAEVEPAALLGAATVAEMAALLEQADRGTSPT
jgi:acyl carrier protein